MSRRRCCCCPDCTDGLCPEVPTAWNADLGGFSFSPGPGFTYNPCTGGPNECGCGQTWFVAIGTCSLDGSGMQSPSSCGWSKSGVLCNESCPPCAPFCNTNTGAGHCDGTAPIPYSLSLSLSPQSDGTVKFSLLVQISVLSVNPLLFPNPSQEWLYTGTSSECASQLRLSLKSTTSNAGGIGLTLNATAPQTVTITPSGVLVNPAVSVWCAREICQLQLNATVKSRGSWWCFEPGFTTKNDFIADIDFSTAISGTYILSQPAQNNSQASCFWSWSGGSPTETGHLPTGYLPASASGQEYLNSSINLATETCSAIIPTGDYAASASIDFDSKITLQLEIDCKAKTGMWKLSFSAFNFSTSCGGGQTATVFTRLSGTYSSDSFALIDNASPPLPSGTLTFSGECPFDSGSASFAVT